MKNLSFAKFGALMALNFAIAGGQAAAVSVEFTSPAANIVVEDGMRFALVNGGQSLQFSARAAGSELVNGFQLKFENSAGALHLQNWTTGPNWPLIFDSNLQSASSDYFVAASSLTSNALPVLLGTFHVSIPDTEDDFLLTVASDPGFLATGFTNASGPLPISDYGDLVIRARPDPPAIAGDYDRNGTVGPEDFARWKSTFGSQASLHADGNGNGIVDAADYTIWRDALGDFALGVAAVRSATMAPTQIPEPMSLALLLSGIAIGGLGGRRHGPMSASFVSFSSRPLHPLSPKLASFSLKDA